MIYEANHIYHIYNQGNNKQRIFYSEANYTYFLKKMEKHLLPYVDIIAYCLMPNHFHWLVRTKDRAVQDSPAVKPCSRLELELMAIEYELKHGLAQNDKIKRVPSRQQNLSHQIGQLISSYAKAINKQENRSGSLFRSKTKAKDGGVVGTESILGSSHTQIFSDSDPYWHTCFNYIHKNPVTARLVDKEEKWKHSSIHEYQGTRSNQIINLEFATELDLVEKEFIFDKHSIHTSARKFRKAPKGALHVAKHGTKIKPPNAKHRAASTLLPTSTKSKTYVNTRKSDIPVRFNKLHHKKSAEVKYSKLQQIELTKMGERYLEKDEISSIDELNELLDILHFHEWRYYVQDDPILSDRQYDSLYELLESTEAKNPKWIRDDSPTQRVGSDLSSDFQTVDHLSPMLSLPNSYNADDLNDFDKQIKKLTLIETDPEYVVEPKFDGGTIVLIYENDKLIRGATRGNGAQGDEITHNIKTMRSIPLAAEFSKYGITKAELRGEALIRKDLFEEMNRKREKEGLDLFANPRNTATGGLRTKNPRESEARSIEAFIYQISFAEGPGKNNILTQADSINLLVDLGFKVPIDESKVCKNINEAAEYCSQWQEKRETYAYEIDGMVIKLNDFELQKKAGETSHHPRWAMAYKFKAKQATTILEQIVYQVGKIGTITPVAKVKPVSLAGVTVSSISLHNEDFINQKDLRLGDTILIERAGDVIPYIVKSFPELRTGKEKVIKFPEQCPINNDASNTVDLIRDENEAAWRCPTCVCGSQDLQRMIFFVSKDAMNIDGMGKSIIEKFHELNWITDISNIFNLNYNAIAELEGFGARSAEKLELAIEKVKSNPIYRLLFGLGIHHLGQRAAKILAAEIKNVKDLKNWSEEQFKELKDIGPVLTRNVMEWFSSDENIALLDRLEASGVNLSQTDADRPKDFSSGPLAGKTILFTGTLKQMGRKEAQSIAESLGAKNISGVSKNLDILVAGEKAGSKLKKAQALGTVQVLTEDEFLSFR